MTDDRGQSTPRPGNAKKYIEKGQHGGNVSDTHKPTVTGDIEKMLRGLHHNPYILTALAKR